MRHVEVFPVGSVRTPIIGRPRPLSDERRADAYARADTGPSTPSIRKSRISSNPAWATVTTANNGYTTILKTSDVEFIPNRLGDGVGSGSWTVTIESRDPQPQAWTDTIDILPYNGDGRGTSFSGTYTLGDVVLFDGGTLYYTDADPATLSDDPAHEDNGAPNAPSALWSTERPANPTAVRVIGGELPSGGSFAFQIAITTDGAQAQDVYVNRAQARAGHTELLMRTSAALVVTDYLVEKSSNPESGSTVRPGDVVEYTVTVSQMGDVPAGAWFSDDMSDVLDDADYNGDVTASHGEVLSFEDGILEWEGVIPVGEVATITYSVTVKSANELEAGDDTTFLNNQVSSPGCQGACATEHPVGYYTVSKTADPASGETVRIGDVITYHVQVTQRGEGAVESAFFDDDLTEVLDDAVWNDDAAATAGELSYSEPVLSWSGGLEVGQVVDLTYSMEVHGEGDFVLENVVTSVCADDDADCLEAICVPAADENPDCRTVHYLGDYEVMKTSNPVSGEAVEVGDVIEYTITVNHIGVAAVEAAFDDDLSAVLDDATWNDDVSASAGTVSFEDETLSWWGVLSQGDVVTVTYSVTVTAEGDRYLENVVTTDGWCVPAEGQDEACRTEHINGAYTYSKTSESPSGSTVVPGEVVTYTVLVEHVGTAAVTDAIVTDDLSGVLPYASWNDGAEASSGTVIRDGETLTWTGDLAIGQIVEITYSVTVGDLDEVAMVNVVTSPDDRAVCVPGADENPDCTTEHVNGGYTFGKTSDPASGSAVAAGDVVTYTVEVAHYGTAAVAEAIVTDDLSEVLPYASWNDDAQATSGTVVFEGESLTWTGDLAIGEIVEITYSVTIGDHADVEIVNVVTSPDERAVSVDATDGNPDCTTDHHTPPGETPPGATPPGPVPGLPHTGVLLPWGIVLTMLLLIACGGAMTVSQQRKAADRARQELGIDKF